MQVEAQTGADWAIGSNVVLSHGRIAENAGRNPQLQASRPEGLRMDSQIAFCQ
jgi:hypothetical protein